MDMMDIVTIDGPAGSGKSTVARKVAERLRFNFMDTGAMYRTIALGAAEKGVLPNDEKELKRYLEKVQVRFDFKDMECKCILMGEDVTDAIRKNGMGKTASDFSKSPVVRRYCSGLQRKLGARGKWVVEGRDMGTVVFPDAKWKFYLTASLEVRAGRRWSEQCRRGENVSYESVMRSIQLRDKQDSKRAVAPLKPAEDALIIDTSHMTIEEVVRVIVENVRKKY